jgi:transposase
MYYTQNQKIEQVSQDAMVVGVDIGSKWQYARAFDHRGLEIAHVFKFSNDRSGFELFLDWMRNLASEKGFKKIIVGMEPTGHYWFPLRDFLAKEGIELVLVNPLHVKQSKELDDNNQTKNDRKDPLVIARLVCEGRYSFPYIPEGIYADLRIYWANRERYGKQQIAVKNRILRWFSIYFPEYTTVFGDVFCKSSRMLLLQACLPAEMVTLGAEGINQIWRDQKLRAVGMKRATTLFAAAQRSIGQQTGVAAAREELEELLEEWDFFARKIEHVTEKMTDILDQISEAKQLQSIPGVGLLTVAGFLAEVGDVRRFTSPKQLLKLAGLALRESSSGKHKGRTTISKRGRSRLRKTIFNAAISVIHRNGAFKKLHTYYTTRQENPLKKKQSVVAVGCKLVRIFYALFMSDKPYDGEKMLSDIHRPEAA